MAVAAVPSSGTWQTFPEGSQQAANTVSPVITEIVMRLLQTFQYQGEKATLDSLLGSLSARTVTALSFHASKRKDQVTENISALETSLAKVDDQTRCLLQHHVDTLKAVASTSSEPFPVAQGLLLRILTLAQNIGILEGRSSILQTKLNAEQGAMGEEYFAMITALPQEAAVITAELLSVKKTLREEVVTGIKPVLAHALRTLEGSFQMDDGDARLQEIRARAIAMGGAVTAGIPRYIRLKDRLLQIVSQAEFTKLLAALDQDIALLDRLSPRPPEQLHAAILARIASQFWHICALAGNKTLLLLATDLRSLERRRMLVLEKQKVLEEAGSLAPATPFHVLPFVRDEKRFAVICFLEKLLTKLERSVPSKEEQTAYLAEIRQYINSTLNPDEQEELNNAIAELKMQFRSPFNQESPFWHNESTVISAEENKARQEEINAWIAANLTPEQQINLADVITEYKRIYRSPHNRPTLPLHLYIDKLLLFLDTMIPLFAEDLADAAKGVASNRMQYLIMEELNNRLPELETKPDSEQQALIKAAFDAAVSRGMSQEHQRDLLMNIFDVAARDSLMVNVEVATDLSPNPIQNWVRLHAFDNWYYFAAALETQMAGKFGGS